MSLDFISSALFHIAIDYGLNTSLFDDVISDLRNASSQIKRLSYELRYFYKQPDFNVRYYNPRDQSTLDYQAPLELEGEDEKPIRKFYGSSYYKWTPNLSIENVITNRQQVRKYMRIQDHFTQQMNYGHIENIHGLETMLVVDML
jgi:hypothetical protein